MPINFSTFSALIVHTSVVYLTSKQTLSQSIIFGSCSLILEMEKLHKEQLLCLHKEHHQEVEELKEEHNEEIARLTVCDYLPFVLNILITSLYTVLNFLYIAFVSEILLLFIRLLMILFQKNLLYTHVLLVTNFLYIQLLILKQLFYEQFVEVFSFRRIYSFSFPFKELVYICLINLSFTGSCSID